MCFWASTLINARQRVNRCKQISAHLNSAQRRRFVVAQLSLPPVICAVSMDSQTVRDALVAVHPLKALDDDILTYLSSMVADGDAATTGSVEALVETVGPFLESCGIAPTDADVRKLCKTIFDSLVAKNIIKPAVKENKNGARGGKTGINAKGLSAAAQASLKALGLVEEDEDEAVKILNAPVKLGGGGGPGSNLDFLWGRENNAYLNQNQVRGRVRARYAAARW